MAYIYSKGICIEYYDCLDNHSRLEPIKSDSLDLESLTRIIPWFLKERLAIYEGININSNTYDEDIIDFTVLGYRVAGVHGHKDKSNKVVEGLTLLTKEHFDLILTAHYHHFSCDERNETLVVSNGSLMGTDNYAKNLRLCSKPSQNLIIVTNESVADYIKRIPLE
jgi:predicted phosphodiesterase